MPQRTDIFSLGRLGLSSGEGRRLALPTALAPLELGGERYAADPEVVPDRLDVSRTTGSGYALRLRFGASLSGPCMRCLGAAAPRFDIDVREVNQPGAGDELRSPYVDDEDDLDLSAWARAAFAPAPPGPPASRPGPDRLPARVPWPLPALRCEPQRGARPRARGRARPPLGEAVRDPLRL